MGSGGPRCRAEAVAHSRCPSADPGRGEAPKLQVQAAQDTAVELSVVVAAFEEADTLPKLWQRLAPVLDGFENSELVVVDDGSKDATWSVICELAGHDPRVRGIRLSRNFGQQAALTTGLEAASGAVVACIDADLQDPPELLPEMVERLRAGAEVVYAVRRTRDAGPAKRLAYRAFYRLYRSLAEIDVPLDSGDFAVLDRRVVDQLIAMPERTRFLRGLRSWVGFRQEPFEYDRPGRAVGQPKYTLRKLVRLAIDGLVSLSSLPLRAASILGMLTAIAGVIYIGVAVAARLLLQDVPEGWTSLIAIILVLGGAQLTVIGVLGEYVARIYDEVKRRPHAVVRDQIGVRSGS
ncbi:MAG TPA: glycosyltransferase [Acidimicrobiaceae bacterium]|nr:glycosyltransferase [Acidimicrobiaceae bacterium]